MHDQSEDTIYAIDCTYGAPQCGYDILVAKDGQALLECVADPIAESMAADTMGNDPDMTSDEALELAWSYFGPVYETTASEVCCREHCGGIVFLAEDETVHRSPYNFGKGCIGCLADEDEETALFIWDYLTIIDD